MDFSSRQMAARTLDLVRTHTQWRQECLNLVAAECVASPSVKQVLASDTSNRYSSSGVYAGSKYVDELHQQTQQLARDLFGAEFAEVRPVTGNTAVLAVLLGLTEAGDTVITTNPKDGGYPLSIAEQVGVHVEYFPYCREEMAVDEEAAVEMIHRIKPHLVFCGSSSFLFPYPVRRLAQAAHEVGAVLAHDGCHVLGLIAGKAFPDPLSEGADILIGSTHKTFPGPQGGIVLGNDGELMERISRLLGAPPYLLSCVHQARIAALGIALAEMREFGFSFASQVVRNSQALARSLQDTGIPVTCSGKGFTRSHQVILDNEGFASKKGWAWKNRLEECDILVDAIVRLGTQEVARLGMREDEMAVIASLIADALLTCESAASVRRKVAEFVSNFQSIQYSVDQGAPAYQCERVLT